MTPTLPTVALIAFVGGSFVCGLTAVHVVGLVAAAMARLAEGTRYERWCQAACLVALGAVGAVCGLTLEVGPGVAAASAVTLMVMTMIAIIDVPRPER
ncbi:MAG: hypothetical protein ACOYK7_10690 [Pirellulales bacterium]|jgi:hypothetical protein